MIIILNFIFNIISLVFLLFKLITLVQEAYKAYQNTKVVKISDVSELIKQNKMTEKLSHQRIPSKEDNQKENSSVSDSNSFLFPDNNPTNKTLIKNDQIDSAHSKIIANTSKLENSLFVTNELKDSITRDNLNLLFEGKKVTPLKLPNTISYSIKNKNESPISESENRKVFCENKEL